MASQDHIKTHVAAVRSEARSLIARYRAERQAKYARPATSSASAASAEASGPELPVAAQPAAAAASAPANSRPAFAASPSIDRLLAGRTPADAAKAAQPHAQAAARPSIPARAANGDPAKLLGLEPLIARQGETLANVLSSTQSTRKPAGGAGLKRGHAEALGLLPLIDFGAQLAPAAQATRHSPPPAAPAEPSPAAGAAALHPLSAIAAIGPGLKLKLSEIGVGSIEDLAAASEADLREKLGAIGALVRLDVWIKEAQDLVASSPRK